MTELSRRMALLSLPQLLILFDHLLLAVLALVREHTLPLLLLLLLPLLLLLLSLIQFLFLILLSLPLHYLSHST